MTRLDTVLADALAHHRAGHLAMAEAAYRDALALSPTNPAILHNLGAVQAARGDHTAALAAFDAALAAEPRYATAHFNRGLALHALGRTRDAIAALEAASRIEPGHYETHRALGFLWLALGNRDRSLDHFARTCELRRGEDRAHLAARSLEYATRGKLDHDAEQFRYLATRRRDGQRYELLARVYEDVASGFPEAPTRLSPQQIDRLGEDYNTPIHIGGAPEIPGSTISPTVDATAVERAFRAAPGAAAVIDNLLSEPALAALRRYLLESTIWHDFEHIAGFLASYLEDGLACPLVLQIADDLRRALPGILGKHPLSQAWAFKGLDEASTVAAHADDAAVSVNFWVTDDAANLQPGQGGLVVCRTPPPLDWEIAGYEADQAEIEAFIDAQSHDALVAPYAANRAVLFQSRLFHRSNAPRFAPGYANRRINVTLLFGVHHPHARGAN